MSNLFLLLFVLLAIASTDYVESRSPACQAWSEFLVITYCEKKIQNKKFNVECF